MSHVAKVDCVFRDLNAIKTACTKLGLVFVEGKKTYKWYGTHVGDYPLPEGFTKADLGKCEHAIQLPGCQYEIGLARNKNGDGFSMLYDFYDHGLKLSAIVDSSEQGNGKKFIDAYNHANVYQQAKLNGYFVAEKQVGSKVVLTLSKS